jgi:RNA polymerase sigma-70 factor (ECF subfamily)
MSRIPGVPVYVYTDMGDHISPAGGFDARYVAFLETISQLRPSLHRYCSRMTGSVLDGEDVVQDALFEAYRKLDQFDDSRPVAPWIFRIAHNRCVDFLRRKARDTAEVNVPDPESIPAAGAVSFEIRPAIERLVLTLPPKERACVLLKEVFEYSLQEIADLIGSSVGAVKSALNRGRSKLSSTLPATRTSRTPDPELNRVLKLYIERFNRRDWDGLRELISADAQLRVVDAFAGRFADSPYFSNYERWSMPWKLGVAEVEGETVVVVLRRDVDTFSPYSFVRLHMSGQQIDRIVDYSHCPWIVPVAEDVVRVHVP